MSEIINSIVPYILPIICTFLSALGKGIYDIYMNHRKMRITHDVIHEVIQYVEQKCKETDIHGDAKLNMALGKASEWLKSKGIKISQSELEILIESTVYELNKGGNIND